VTIPEAQQEALQAASEHPSLLYAVKRVEQAIRAHLDGLLKPAGITALQYTALTVLARHDGLPAARLARNSFVTAQSMADMVRILEEHGLITRERNPRNRRELLIRLTDPGRRLLDDYAERVAALQGRMVHNFSPRQLDQFHSALAASYHALH
jgi:DNA-binding MarR family transcriptional regulator